MAYTPRGSPHTLLSLATQDDRTHVGLDQIFGPEGALNQLAVKHGLYIDRDSLDEGLAAGGRPAQVMWDAHASVSSACFLPSNRSK